jgi:cytochrome c oxidase subunit 2
VHKWWTLLFGGVMAACALLFVVAPFVGWWLPKNVSSYGGGVDGLFYLILGITGFFFILTEAILVYNIFKFGNPAPDARAQYIHGNHKLEVFWTAIPAAVLLLVALLQIRTWEDIKYRSRMPQPTSKQEDQDNFQFFEVSARQFEWRVRYPAPETMKMINSEWGVTGVEPKKVRDWSKEHQFDDIHAVNEVHTWKDANVRFYLTTKDVLHSFYLPNLRLKQDAVPGKTIPVWFRATESNIEWDGANGKWKHGEEWDLACAELCGWGHYKMIGRLWVHKDRADFDRWLKEHDEEQNQTKP